MSSNFIHFCPRSDLARELLSESLTFILPDWQKFDVIWEPESLPEREIKLTLFSVLSSPVVSSLRAATDSTISIGCSDVTENTYVLLLEWRCRGECSEGGRETLVKFTRGRGAGSQRDPRHSLNEENFDLTVTGVRLEDAGEYFCLVNNKLEGQDIVRLTTVGESSVIVTKINIF